MTVPNDPTTPSTPEAPVAQADAAAPPAPPADGAGITNGTETVAAPPAPKREPLTPETMAEEIDRLDRVLVGLLVLLAFLLGSFVAKNHDFWFQLASGRSIAHGGVQSGQDPFAFTTSGAAWVNPSWLYDLIIYKIAGARDSGEVPPLQGAVLVVLKALLVTALAGVLLLIRRRGQSLWIPVACVAAAMLCSSPRFLLQSTCISYLFLALTLYLLVMKPTAEQRARQGALAAFMPPSPWLLIPLFALWANLDGWFFLGPLTVGLFWASEALQQMFAPVRTGDDAPEPGEINRLGIVFVAGLAACMINPFGYRIFTTLPTDLWLSLPGNSLQDDDFFRLAIASPLGGDYFTPAGIGLRIAGFMYLPLLVAGVLSFAVNSDNLRWWRVTLWLVFCLMSAWMSRLIPFFAIVGAPITALNFQDFAARRFGTVPRVTRNWKLWSLGGRIASVVVGAVLLALAWPGWLLADVGDFWSPRRVGWAVAADPLEVQAVRRLAEYQKEGLLTNGFNLTPEIASYYAWFAPGEKAFFDNRFAHYPRKVTEDYIAIRKKLRNPGDAPAPAPAEAGSEANAEGHADDHRWVDYFREYGIDHVVITADDPQRDTLVFQMIGDPGEWVLLYLDGRNTVFAWLDPEKPASTRAKIVARRFDPNRLAFAPEIPESQRPPRQQATPAEPPQTPSLLAGYWGGPPPPPAAVAEANIDLVYDQIIEQFWPSRSVAAQYIGMFGTITPPLAICGPAAIPFTLATTWRLPPEQVQLGFDPDPAGASYLALRAARRAIGENPQDAPSYRYLGDAYIRLWRKLEARWCNNAHALATLRHVQTISALQSELAIQPNNPQTHFNLGDLLMRTDQLDLALEQTREGLKLLHENGPNIGETRETFDDMLGKRENFLQEFEKQVQQRQNDYELKAKDKPPAYRAQIAYERGLAGQALQDVSEIDPSQVTEREARVIVKLLLNMGRLRELQPFTRFEQPMDRAMVAAALGNYEDADQILQKWLEYQDVLSAQHLLFLLRAETLQNLVTPQNLAVGMEGAVAIRRERADWTVVRGILSLEAGDTQAAARRFQEALDIGTHRPGGKKEASTDPATQFHFDSEPLARHYLQLLQNAGTVPTPEPAHTENGAPK